MNYVKGLASLLDVELGEEFILDGRTSLKYRFVEESVLECCYKDRDQ